MPYISVLFILALLFRLPLLINPEQMNSDFAFIGVQAMKILQGEFSWYLWGSGYQGTLEPLIAAGLFAIFGKTFFVLMLVPLIAYLGCLYLVFKILKNELGDSKAFVLSLILVFCSRVVIDQNVLPYRQWSILCVLMVVYWLQKLPKAKPYLWFSATLMLYFALYVDFFTLQCWVPLIAVLFFLSRTFKMAQPFYLANAIGLLFTWYSRLYLNPAGGIPISFNIFDLPNLKLFFLDSFPTLMGLKFTFVGFIIILFALYKSFKEVKKFNIKNSMHVYFAYSVIQILFSCAVFIGHRGDPTTVRYLSPIIYLLPLALMPWAKKINTKDLSFYMAPYLVGIALFGWLQMTGDFIIRRDPNQFVSNSRKLQERLQTEKIKYAYAYYWIAYQLDFLFQENPVIIPRPGNVFDRYHKYISLAQQEPLIAEVYFYMDIDRLLNDEHRYQKEGRLVKKLTVDGYTILIIKQHG